MRYMGIIKNDFSAAPGVCLTFFVQGCPIHCKGCHNPESWDFEGGKKFTFKVLDEIKEGLTANGIKRTFCIMGGEPLCKENIFFTHFIVKDVLKDIPDLKVWIWTGQKTENILDSDNMFVQDLLDNITGIVTEPYIEELRDITLPMRGSSNQKIINLEERRNNDNEKK